MHSETFDNILKDRFEKSYSVLSTKATEYASSEDVLHNFRRAGTMLNQTPEQALIGMLTKHWVSILDLVDSGKTVDVAVIDEKIGDAINYLILLEALMLDKNRPNPDIIPNQDIIPEGYIGHHAFNYKYNFPGMVYQQSNPKSYPEMSD